MKHRSTFLLATTILLMGCTVGFGGLPAGKAGLNVGGLSLARAISDQKDTITLAGTGPDGVALEEQVIESGATVLALDPGPWSFTVLIKDSSGAVLQEDTQDADLLVGEITTLNFTVHTRGTVAGRLLDEAGNPLVGATLWVADLDTMPATIALRTLTSDGDGRFAAEDLPRGKLQVLVMDLEGSSSAPTTGSWWKPWVIEASQTQKVDLGDASPVVSKLYFPTQTPDSVDLPEVPMKLVSVDLDSPVEWAWSTKPSAMIYFFYTPDAASTDKYVFRAEHPLYEFGTEPNYARNYTAYFRYESDLWVYFNSSDPTRHVVNTGGSYPGLAGEIRVQMKNANGVQNLNYTNGFNYPMNFDVSGPGISGVVNLSSAYSTTGILTLINALPGVYTFVPTTLSSTSGHFNTFTVTVGKPGELIQLDKSADVALLPS